MPSSISVSQLGGAVLNFVQNGTYPDSEDIVSADFPPSASSQVLELFDNARDGIKTRICASSRETAQDIDGWISQAKQLRSDLETAQRASRDILLKAEQNKKLRQSVHDAGSKLRLLEGEVVFNENLTATLEQIKEVRHQIGQTENLLNQGHLPEAVELSLKTETNLALIKSGRNIRATAVLQEESKNLRQDIKRALTKRWNDFVQVNDETSTVSLRPEIGCLSKTASAMQQVGVLESFIADLADKLEGTVIMPRLSLAASRRERPLIVGNSSMRVSDPSSQSDMHHLLSDLGAFIELLQTHLPPSIIGPLSKTLGPNLVKKLISMRLSSAVPEELAALQDFGSTREEVYQFSETMHSHGWPGVDQLQAWTTSIPEVWLEKRRRNSLNQVRQLLKRGFGKISTVERVETQVVSQQDHLFTRNTSSDDWNAGWSDEEDGSPVEKKAKSHNAIGDDEEEDGHAWGLDYKADEESKSKGPGPSADDDVQDDAWGWGDDKETEETEESPKTPQREINPSRRDAVNGHVDPHPMSGREITLKETYNTTSLPIGILDLINSVLADQDAVSEQSSSNPAIASAVPGLSSLPSLLLVMYRASASSFYSIDSNGNMFLYNDCLWLVDQLQQIVQTRTRKQEGMSARNKDQPCFDGDIAALETFGKRSYGKEMESQRTIIRDLLDGAQGFANCTEPPFSRECDLAITSIVDRLRDIYKQWKGVLSHSALLQSVGSLLSSVIDKFIVDIEDMSDISEPESQRLTAYCKQVTALEDLFLPQQEPASSGQQQEPVPLTAVYAPGWFKFQYLSEILDSSLVDIKYLWTDGGLKLEYDVEEVVDLIEALFADSEHRRRAIGEIRRSSGR